MTTLQRFYTGQDKSYNVRLTRAVRRLVTPKRTAAYTAPVKKVWRRQVKRVRAVRGNARRIRLFVGIGASIIALDAAITAVVIVLRRIAQAEARIVPEADIASETPAEQADAAMEIEAMETVLA